MQYTRKDIYITTISTLIEVLHHIILLIWKIPPFTVTAPYIKLRIHRVSIRIPSSNGIVNVITYAMDHPENVVFSLMAESTFVHSSDL